MHCFQFDFLHVYGQKIRHFFTQRRKGAKGLLDAGRAKDAKAAKEANFLTTKYSKYTKQ